jgi:serine/threonine protein phosphatase PrpC
MMELTGATNVGLVRRNNEDGYSLAPDLNLAIVADGMGGAACGEVASALTIETVLAKVRELASDLTPEELLKEAIRQSNRRVREASEGRQDCKGMGSTVVLALWRGSQLFVANVGDSRAYLYRDSKLTQLSYDQNIANELRNGMGMSDEEISRYPHRNVLTMAIGAVAEVMVRTRSEPLQPGDLILLCSDGLYGPVGDDMIAEMLSRAADLPASVDEMIAKAIQCGGPDNITVVLMRWEE